MDEPLSHAEIARVRAIQLSLGAVKICNECGQRKPVSEFARYGRADCTACEEAAELARERAAKDAIEAAERAERERAQKILASQLCACGMSKPAHLQRCRWCQGRWRAGAVQTARAGVGA